MRVRHALELLWRHRAWPLGAIALGLTLVSFLASDDLLVRGAGHLVVAWWLAMLFVLPFSLTVVLSAASFGVAYLLDVISATKVGLTQLPLMAFDLRVVAAYPDAFLQAMALTRWQRAGLYAAILFALVVIGFVTVWQVRRTLRRHAADPRKGFRTALVATAVIAVIAAQLAAFMVRLPDIVDRSRFVTNVWAPSVVVDIERRLGTVAFLYYSRELERRSSANLVFAGAGGTPPDDARLAAAAESMLRLGPVPHDSLPNIVLVKVESTFDINEAFHLTAPVRSLIFDRDSALAYGALRVNAVGGGSWISEFEVIAGVDSRLFGFAGFYTHAGISPWMRGSLASWLGDRGYHTVAFYPVEGSFHNVRRAFPRYGFDQFLDSDDFGFEAWKAPDSTIAAAYLRHLTDESAPFFAFFVLNENHGPYRCRHFERPEELLVRLSGNAAFEVDCGLSEFVRSLRSSEHALRAITERLQSIERSTGRPWLIVSFGDHQPYSLTGSGGYTDDYSPYRRSSDLQETMYRFAGSAPSRFTAAPGFVPITLLPTLISAFVARDAGDLYLGANLVLFQACGVDGVGGTWSYTTEGTLATSLPDSDTDCRTALRDAIASYRSANIFRLVDGT
jgi:hypothetical protein